jgi:predicted  nucleic acid-binding Zn-ribbon protein
MERVPAALSDAIFDFDTAISRLNRALKRLDGAVDGLFNQMDQSDRAQGELDVLIRDRARLAEELDASLSREKELEEIADEASEALGSAIAEVRAALGRVS